MPSLIFFCIRVLYVDYVCPPSYTCPIHPPALRTLLGWLGNDSHRKVQHHGRGNKTFCWAWGSLLPYLCALVSVWTSFVSYCCVPISHPLLTIEMLMSGSIFLFLLNAQEKKSSWIYIYKCNTHKYMYFWLVFECTVCEYNFGSSSSMFYPKHRRFIKRYVDCTCFPNLE